MLDTTHHQLVLQLQLTVVAPKCHTLTVLATNEDRCYHANVLVLHPLHVS